MNLRRSRAEQDAQVDPQAVIDSVHSALGKLGEASADLERAVKSDDPDGGTMGGGSELKVLHEQVLDVALQTTVLEARLKEELKTAKAPPSGG